MLIPPHRVERTASCQSRAALRISRKAGIVCSTRTLAFYRAAMCSRTMAGGLARSVLSSGSSMLRGRGGRELSEFATAREVQRRELWQRSAKQSFTYVISVIA